MPRKTPYGVVDIIQSLYSQGLSVAEVARRTDVHYKTVWGYIAAKKNGFASYWAYQKYLAKKRQQQPETQELRDLIKKRLKNMNKNQSWLAEQLGVRSKTVSSYVTRRSIPNRTRLRRLFTTLQVDYQTLDDLL